MKERLVETLQQKEKQQNSANAMLKKFLVSALKEKGYIYEQAVG